MFAASRLALTSGARLFAHSRPHVYLSHRFIFSTSPRLASESSHPSSSDLELYTRLQNTKLGQKFQQSPEALQAVSEFIELLRKEGFDVSSGKPPSQMQLLKLGFKSNVRDGLVKLNDVLQKAGMDMTDKDMLAEVMAAVKKD